MIFGIRLSLYPVSQKFDHVALLSRVTEIVSDGRLQHLGNQVLHITETSDHLRGFITRYVNDLRYIKIKGKTIR